MIIVTGTKRSGTSMWMKVLGEAGLPILGSKFPSNWEKTIKEANLGGFYESRLRDGINFTTNPDPKTGFYIGPHKHESHVIKLFIPGLVRTDLAYVDKVVATIRPWKEFCTSITRLRAMEDAHRPVGEQAPVYLQPELEWWSENFSLIRDFSIRKYPLYMVAYDSVIENPERVTKDIIKWIGIGNVENGYKVVSPSYRTQKGGIYTPISAITDDIATVFDELYERVKNQSTLDNNFLIKLIDDNTLLTPVISDEIKAAQTRTLK